MDDWQVAERLVMEFGIAVVPGESCGMPGWMRVCYANLPKDKCKEAADRLEKGLCTIFGE